MFSYLKVKLFWRHILNPMLQFSTLAVPVLGWSLEDLLCYYLLCRGVDCSAIISALNACSLPKWVLVTTSGHANEPHSDADSFQNNELYTVNLIHNAQTPMQNVLFVQYDGHYFLGYFSNVFLGWKLQNLYHFSFSSTENIIFSMLKLIYFIYLQQKFVWHHISLNFVHSKRHCLREATLYLQQGCMPRPKALPWEKLLPRHAWLQNILILPRPPRKCTEFDCYPTLPRGFF